MRQDRIRTVHAVACSVTASFFLLSLFGIIFKRWDGEISHFVNRNYNGEGFIETLEALLWLGATTIFGWNFYVSFPRGESWIHRAWIGFFAIFFFAALGEEISWGQHLFHYAPSNVVLAFNKQHEYNIHNLNLSKIFGFKGSLNFNIILNPIFYTLCTIFWVVLPYLKRGERVASPFVQCYPEPSVRTSVYCGVCALVYLVVDKLFFDVGEIFELSLAFTAFLAAYDVHCRNRSPAPTVAEVTPCASSQA